MKKKWLAIATAVALSVGLAAAPAEAQTTSKDRQYLALVKSHANTNGVSNRSLIKMGKQVCKTFDAGATLYEIVEAIADSATDEEISTLFAATIAAGVIVYCPRHESKLD